jgi:hypothetical protein
VRPRRLEPEEAAIYGAALFTLVFTCVMVWLVDRNSGFRGDDLIVFSEARAEPFWKFIATPMDVHAVPLHRMVTYLVTLFGRTYYRECLAVLLGFHVLGVVFLYRALQAFARNPGNAVATYWYASYVNLCVLFQWWLSGMHRLPCIALTSIAIFSYARFRREQTWAWAICTLLSIVTALGFFEKGVFIPVALAVIEASFFLETPPRERRNNALLLVGLFAFIGAYLAVWRHTVGDSWSALTLRPEHATYLRIALQLLVSSTVGRVIEWFWPGLALWALLIGVTTKRAPRNAILWAGAILVVSTSLITTALSAPRWTFWGYSMLLDAQRYYPDVMVLLVVFAALAWQRAFPSGAEALWGRQRRWLVATSALTLMAALGLISLISSERMMRELYVDPRRGKFYLEHVVEGMDELASRDKVPTIVEGTMPRYINQLGGETARHSLMLQALGYRFHIVDRRAAKRRRGPIYEITEEGNVQRFSRK